MELIDRILSKENIGTAIKAVERNKGAAGIDKMPVEALRLYFFEHLQGGELTTWACTEDVVM